MSVECIRVSKDTEISICKINSFVYNFELISYVEFTTISCIILKLSSFSDSAMLRH